jgi:hypothetical protein
MAFVGGRLRVTGFQVGSLAVDSERDTEKGMRSQLSYLLSDPASVTDGSLSTSRAGHIHSATYQAKTLGPRRLSLAS